MRNTAVLLGLVALLSACAGAAEETSQPTPSTVDSSLSGLPSTTADGDTTPTPSSSVDTEESEFSPAARTGLVALCKVLVGPETPNPPATAPRDNDPASIQTWINFFDSLNAYYIGVDDQLQSALATPEFLDAVGSNDSDAVQDYTVIQAILSGMFDALDTEDLSTGRVEAYDIESTWRRAYRPIERLCPQWDGETWSTRA